MVGAVVLALAAAVLLPLLLENEPKPLGDDISIQIPPVDSGKFVNPLSPAAPAEQNAKGSIAGDEAPPAPRSPSDAAKTKGSIASTPSSGETSPSPSAETAATQSAPPTEAQKQIAEAKPAAAAPAIPAPAAPEATPQAPTASAESGPDSAKASGPFVVQVAAFSDRYGARSLVAKLKKVGFPAFIETVTTDKGTLHRVRVGPYPSREVADTARAKLKAAGFAGVVARNA